MTIDNALRQRITDLIAHESIVLFMKGNRASPACGFSSQVVSTLDSLIDHYHTVDVLQDPEIREGIKAFSEWPTIPQLYIHGEFVGGCDIIVQMFESGELEKSLGVDSTQVPTPTLNISEQAAQQFLAALADTQGEHDSIRIEIDARYQHGLATDSAHDADIKVQTAGLQFVLDRASARKADGLTITFVANDESGFHIENPHAPPSVRQLSVDQLATMLREKKSMEFFDVRSEEEREIACIPEAKLLNDASLEHLLSLPRETPVVLLCHHGTRSQNMAAQLIAEGFREVSNVTGGIDAWSIHIDPKLPRY